MIDPNTAPDGEEYLSYCRRRWGGDGWTNSMRRMGKHEGVPYAKWLTWPNTTHCSRLLLRAEKFGLADKTIGLLYDMCYEQGENVSLRDTVARAATEAGIPGGDAYIKSDEGLAELQQELQTATVNGKRISAAPTFGIRAGRAVHDFSGAQDYDTWVDILAQCAELAKGARQ
mmetsp:Transcript_39995/g.105711  ORF Transcript_39995/g.105711 Transcript_39995/m.105711 type:complete len:172 (+) Transcript_39995:178-693(+)